MMDMDDQDLIRMAQQRLKLLEEGVREAYPHEKALVENSLRIIEKFLKRWRAESEGTPLIEYCSERGTDFSSLPEALQRLYVGVYGDSPSLRQDALITNIEYLILMAQERLRRLGRGKKESFEHEKDDLESSLRGAENYLKELQEKHEGNREFRIR
ncbi:MAG: hypothetical protein WCT28_02810 [Patescibacteria group bacterium]